MKNIFNSNQIKKWFGERARKLKKKRKNIKYKNLSNLTSMFLLAKYPGLEISYFFLSWKR